MSFVLFAVGMCIFISFDLASILQLFFFCYRQGGKPGANVTCATCQGRGIKISLRPLGPGMMQQIQSVCSTCNGEGKQPLEILIFLG
jgi:DnaJ-class molecular chaperone